MITITDVKDLGRTDANGQAIKLIEARGLSTDTKPSNWDNGSVFYEMDTHKVFMYDATNSIWEEQ